MNETIIQMLDEMARTCEVIIPMAKADGKDELHLSPPLWFVWSYRAKAAIPFPVEMQSLITLLLDVAPGNMKEFLAGMDESLGHKGVPVILGFLHARIVEGVGMVEMSVTDGEKEMAGRVGSIIDWEVKAWKERKTKKKEDPEKDLSGRKVKLDSPVFF